MTSSPGKLVVCCNSAPAPEWAESPRRLDYLDNFGPPNVRLELRAFVADVYHISDRILDLLEIAAYVYAADRLHRRGGRDLVEYHSWAREWLFRIRVREPSFWKQETVRSSLCDALCFMTGDADYEFDFLPGHSTPPTSLFDVEGFSIEAGNQPVLVTLFSGGLDSLAGALHVLANTQKHVILVSHESQTGTMRTQKRLVSALQSRFHDRVSHYGFRCQLRGAHAAEESQRTRSLLYASIGFAIAQAYGARELDVFENGVTSINLHRREDLMNSRASRTTHPRTIELLSRFFSLVTEDEFEINVPFLWRTKAETVKEITDAGHGELIASSVSCSRTRHREGNATHCGCCFQCIDRRLAVHSIGAEEFDDAGLYSVDVFRSPIDVAQARTSAVDYVRQATKLAKSNVDQFGTEYLVELSDVVDAIASSQRELEKIEAVWDLMSRHAEAVKTGLDRARSLYDDLFGDPHTGSLLDLVAAREHLKAEVHRCVESIRAKILDPLAEILADDRPDDERQLNNLVGGLLRSHEPELRSEHPTVNFAAARVVPDHQLVEQDLLVEAKYIRKSTTPSKASEGIAADLTKYPQTAFTLFLVYDPDRAVSKEREFVRDFEDRGNCRVVFVR